MPVPKLAVRRALALALTAAVMPLAACGDSDDGEAPAAATDRTETVATDPDTAPAPGKPRADDTADRPGTPPSTTSPATPEPSGGQAEEQRIATIVEGMYDDLAAGDARGVCAVMSRAARNQIAQNPPGGSTEAPADRTCEASLAKFLDVAGRTGALQRTLDAEVRGVAIQGGRATVTVSFGGPGGKVQLLEEDGEWRFGVGAVGTGA
jgi:hypothetical protein